MLGMFGWPRKAGATGPRYDCGNICRPIITTILRNRCLTMCLACNGTASGVLCGSAAALTCCLPPANACATYNANGTCGFTCKYGFGNCDLNPFNGCETNFQTSNSHCGSCNHPCTNGQTCQSGVCVCTGCTSGMTCVPGNSNDACGTGGGGCTACVQPPLGGEVCRNGMCICVGCTSGMTCQAGNIDTACGDDGAACVDCTATGKTCLGFIGNCI